MSATKLDSKGFIAHQIELILKLCDYQQNENFEAWKSKTCDVTSQSKATIIEKYQDTKKVDQIGVISSMRTEPPQFVETIDHASGNNTKIRELASDIMREKKCFVILIGGTSGSGKSSLSVSLANKLGGICPVISTDMVRHVIRCIDEASPLLWASSYNAADTYRTLYPSETSDLVIKSYEAQCTIMLPWMQKLVSNCLKHNQSVILEGVHLSPQIVKSIITHVSSQAGILFPIILHISDQKEHYSRFAGRGQEKYTKYFDNIRKINDHLKSEASSFGYPSVNNSNRSLEDTTMEILDLFVKQLEQ